MNELDMELMQDDFALLAASMGFELEDYDSDHAQEECLNRILRDASARINQIKKYIICDDDEGVHEANDSSNLDETQLLRDKLMDENPHTSFTIVAELDL